MKPAATNPAKVQYRIVPIDPRAHLFEVELSCQTPDPAGQRVSMPAWIPGSYMIRDFARHVVSIQARCGSRRVALKKLDKQSWRAAPCRGTLTLRYRVYAWDLSVRGAHLDATHGFFNGTSVFLWVDGLEGEACTVEILPPGDRTGANWQVATTLQAVDTNRQHFGTYFAASYDELIDHPVEMGNFTKLAFQAHGAPHAVTLSGRHDCDGERLVKDLQKVCEAQIRLFEPRKRKPPFEQYLFMTTVLGEGYGGLEHRSSTALIASRADLPYAGMKETTDGYRRFLGLASHEYFHAWNVKRIKPQAFVRYDLDRENHTALLWVFEGFTSYYDDLMLVRSGVITQAQYLKTLGATVNQVARNPGRQMQSVAESSFDAWTKYYRQDENAPNAIVSYYTKGALVALCVDLTIRVRTGSRRSLDDVMRLLWRRYGASQAARRQGLPENGLPDLVLEATGVSLNDEIARWAHGTDELPLAECLQHAGIAIERKAGALRDAMLGARLSARHGELTLASVIQHGACHRAGLCAGDLLLALDGLRIEDRSLGPM
ncbi:MAG: peptidase M61, partial [Quisquiliibacterium sp.]